MQSTLKEHSNLFSVEKVSETFTEFYLRTEKTPIILLTFPFDILQVISSYLLNDQLTLKFLRFVLERYFGLDANLLYHHALNNTLKSICNLQLDSKGIRLSEDEIRFVTQGLMERRCGLAQLLFSCVRKARFPHLTTCLLSHCTLEDKRIALEMIGPTHLHPLDVPLYKATIFALISDLWKIDPQSTLVSVDRRLEEFLGDAYLAEHFLTVITMFDKEVISRNAGTVYQVVSYSYLQELVLEKKFIFPISYIVPLLDDPGFHLKLVFFLEQGMELNNIPEVLAYAPDNITDLVFTEFLHKIPFHPFLLSHRIIKLFARRTRENLNLLDLFIKSHAPHDGKHQQVIHDLLQIDDPHEMKTFYQQILDFYSASTVEKKRWEEVLEQVLPEIIGYESTSYEINDELHEINKKKWNIFNFERVLSFFKTKYMYVLYKYHSLLTWINITVYWMNDKPLSRWRNSSAR